MRIAAAIEGRARRASARLGRVPRRFRSDRRGTSALEYALLGAFLLLVIAAAVGALGTSATGAFNRIANLFV